MTTVQLIVVAMTMWGLASFIMVVFASMLSSRISQQEEMHSLADKWRETREVEMSVAHAAQEMIETP
ncbi:MAG: hypothetical protein Fur0018_21560 [Anaerolineales bacterium]